MKMLLPIGIDSFRRLREDRRYYVDKSLMIMDFIQNGDQVALITRPRRFGKTLNMTMLREFFDITKDSRQIFEGLAIMDTEYATLINTRPVIFLSFKDCKENTPDKLLCQIGEVLLDEYGKYYNVFYGKADENKDCYYSFFMAHSQLRNRNIDGNLLKMTIKILEQAVTDFYKEPPIVLIDEYDQPILSSFEYGYHGEVQTFFSGFYGAALKGQDCLSQAMLTGIQRIVKESIFSQLNNVSVYTVTDRHYSEYFGMTEAETAELLRYYSLELNEAVREAYDGYLFGTARMYNPWSILNYARTGVLEEYWINTSVNALIRTLISEAGARFKQDFDRLITEGSAKVSADLTCSFLEFKHDDTIWGLLINAGYMTVVEKTNKLLMTVRIPNGEVRGEFLRIVADQSGVQSRDLQLMFQYLFEKDMDGFMSIYNDLVLSCTSYFDAAENAYHMLFLGMSISLRSLYKVTSNIEAGRGRYDIRLESLSESRPHIILEFKQGEDIDRLKESALRQILDNQYYSGLHGEVLCLGIAHDKKLCGMAYKTLIA